MVRNMLVVLTVVLALGVAPALGQNIVSDWNFANITNVVGCTMSTGPVGEWQMSRAPTARVWCNNSYPANQGFFTTSGWAGGYGPPFNVTTNGYAQFGQINTFMSFKQYLPTVYGTTYTVSFALYTPSVPSNSDSLCITFGNYTGVATLLGAGATISPLPAQYAWRYYSFTASADNSAAVGSNSYTALTFSSTLGSQAIYLIADVLAVPVAGNIVGDPTFQYMTGTVGCTMSTGPLGEWQLGQVPTARVWCSGNYPSNQGFFTTMGWAGGWGPPWNDNSHGYAQFGLINTYMSFKQYLPTTYGVNYTVSFSLYTPSTPSNSDSLCITFGKRTAVATLLGAGATISPLPAYNTWTYYSFTASADNSAAVGSNSFTALTFSSSLGTGAVYLIANVLAVPVSSGSGTIYTLTGVANPSGGGTVSPVSTTGTYQQVISISETPNSGYAFNNWTATGGATITNPNAASTTLTLGANNCTLTANFVQVYTLTLSPGAQGTATATPSQASYTFGQQVSITMSTITAGNVLDHWVLSGAGTLSNSSALSATLQITGNDTISAVYTSGSYVNNLSPAASDNNVGSLQAPFMTIGKALTKVRASQAQSIVIQQGVYREQPTGTVTGAAGNPITLKSNPGDRVVITGADVIPQAGSVWTQCTSTTASGNANYANMYYTDVNWSGAGEFNGNDFAPFRFSEDEQPLLEAQTPTSGPPGYWAITGTGTSTGTIVDTVHLTQSDSSYWVGSRVLCVIPYCVWGQYQNTELTVTAYNPATSALSITPSKFGYIYAGSSQYYLYGSPRLIGGSGQWATQALSGSNHMYRVWVWPTNGGRPDGHLYQASCRGGNGLYLYIWNGSPGYYIVDGLEVCNNMNGMQVTGTHSGNVITSGGNHIIRNCVSHDNDWSGIDGDYNINGMYIHNLVTKNGLCPTHQFGGEGGPGFQTTGWGGVAMNETWQENEDSYNACDGFYLGTSSLTIVGNYIHHNGQNGHSDGVQLCAGYGNSATVVNNLFNANCDILQTNTSSGILLQNNVALCTIGWGIQSACANTTWNHNTIVGLGGAPAEATDGPLTVTSNLWDFAKGCSIWDIDSTLPYYSDSNLIYMAPQLSMSNLGNVDYYPINWVPWSQYLTLSGMDVHTITNSAPLMNAAPAFMFQGTGPDYGPNNPGYSASTLYVPNYGSPIWELPYTFTGDYIEINGDGVLRQVTNVDLTNSIVTFSPSCTSQLLCVYAVSVFNWKTQTCTTKSMDVMLQAGSPAKGKGGGGSDIGALNFSVADYMAGKLNGNTKRVVPLWPPAPVNLAAAGWKYMNGGTASALTEGGTYTNPNMTGFQLTLSAPLYALSCTNNAAVTVVDNTGATYPINAATLDSTGTVLTIVMTNGALPRNVSWIQVNVGPKLMGANGTDPTTGTNGGPVTGVKSMRFTIN